MLTLTNINTTKAEPSNVGKNNVRDKRKYTSYTYDGKKNNVQPPRPVALGRACIRDPSRTSSIEYILLPPIYVSAHV